MIGFLYRDQGALHLPLTATIEKVLDWDTGPPAEIPRPRLPKLRISLPLFYDGKKNEDTLGEVRAEWPLEHNV